MDERGIDLIKLLRLSSIRSKVLLLSLVLLAIPYVGYDYVKEMEKHLRDNLEESVLSGARAMAGALSDRPRLFERALVEEAATDGDIYAYPLRQAIQLDGYVSDWDAYVDQAQHYDESILQVEMSYPDPLSFEHVAGTHDGYLYALLLVHDEHVVYASPHGERLDAGDHMQIYLGDGLSNVRRYMVTTISSGWVRIEEISVDSRGVVETRREPRIKGEWLEVDGGYVLEIQIPLSMIGTRVGFVVGDIDDSRTRRTQALVSTFGDPAASTVGKLRMPSPEIQNVIKSLGRTPGRRIWVVDRSQRVLARGGSLNRPNNPPPINPLYRLLLGAPGGDMFEDMPVVSNLSGPEVEAALQGNPGTRWRTTFDPDTYIVSAAQSVWTEKGIVGAVVVEETSQAIQTVQTQTLAELLNKTLIVCLAGGLTLLLFASRVSMRLTRLRNEAESAIDEHGRVTGSLSSSHGRDEIGDLSRSFSSMMERLHRYNQYLEQLASRLSHELRTPIAVVHSSLENLELESNFEQSKIYTERAKDGLARLSTIIDRMSEATRLEHALRSAERQSMDLGELVSSSVEGYRLTWPNRSVSCTVPAVPTTLCGAPDLIVQLLDKLVSNAVDFSDREHPIEIRLLPAQATLSLEVTSFGAQLPSAIRGKLFEPMVSMRPHTTSNRPHLGLGLYIVRLIAEFHGGSVHASNLESTKGVCVSVTFSRSLSDLGDRGAGKPV